MHFSKNYLTMEKHIEVLTIELDHQGPQVLFKSLCFVPCSLNFSVSLKKSRMEQSDFVKMKFFNENHYSFQHWLFKIS